MDEEYYQELKDSIQKKAGVLPEFITQNQNLFVQAVSYLIYAFLNNEILENQQLFYIQVPVQELGIRVNEQVRNYNKFQAAINDTLGLFLANRIETINREQLQQNDNVWYLPANARRTYRSGRIISLHNDGSYDVEKNNNTLYNQRGNAWRIHPDLNNIPTLINRFCQKYIVGNNGGFQQYNKVLVLGYNNYETVDFPFNRLNNNNETIFSRHRLLSPLHYTNDISNLRGVAIRKYDAIIVIGDRCSDEIMTRIQNRRMDCKVIIINSDNPDNNLFTLENSFHFSYEDMAFFYEYRMPAIENISFEFPALLNTLNNLITFFEDNAIDNYKKPLMDLTTKMCSRLSPIKENQLEDYIEKFLDSINCNQDLKDSLNNLLYEGLGEIEEHPKWNYIQENRQDYLIYWNFDDKNIPGYGEEKMISHGAGYKRKVATVAKSPSRRNTFCFDTIFKNDKLEAFLKKYCVTGTYAILTYAGLDENMWLKYDIKQQQAKEQHNRSLRNLFDVDFAEEQVGDEGDIERRLDDYVEENGLDWNLYGENVEENINTQYQEKYRVEFQDGTRYIINGRVIYSDRKSSISDVYDEFRSENTDRREIIIRSFIPDENFFEEIVIKYMGQDLYAQCLLYSSLWKQILYELNNEHSIHELYQNVRERGYRSSELAFNNYFRDDAPDFPNKPNFIAILNYLFELDKINEEQKRNSLAARKANDDRRKAGRIFQDELFDWLLNETMINTTLINQFDQVRLEQIKNTYIKTGTITNIRLLERRQ